MKRALLLIPALLAASINLPSAHAAELPAAPATVAQFNISPRGEIRYTELVRPDGYSQVEARLEGEHLWITAVDATGKNVVLHRYFDPLPLKKLQSFVAIVYDSQGQITLLADGSEQDMTSGARRGRAIERGPAMLGNYLTGLVNESLAAHDQSNVSQSPFLVAPMR